MLELAGRILDVRTPHDDGAVGADPDREGRVSSGQETNPLGFAFGSPTGRLIDVDRRLRRVAVSVAGLEKVAGDRRGVPVAVHSRRPQRGVAGDVRKIGRGVEAGVARRLAHEDRAVVVDIEERRSQRTDVRSGRDPPEALRITAADDERAVRVGGVGASAGLAVVEPELLNRLPAEAADRSEICKPAGEHAVARDDGPVRVQIGGKHVAEPRIRRVERFETGELGKGAG